MTIDYIELAIHGSFYSGQLTAEGNNTTKGAQLRLGQAPPRREAGIASVVNDAMEDGSRPQSLHTHPAWYPNGTIKAFFPWRRLPPRAVFRSGVGFLRGASGTDGVFFQVWAHWKENGRETWTRLLEARKYLSGYILPIEVDLGPWSDQDFKLELRVDAGPSAGRDWACWVAPRIESRESGSASAVVQPEIQPEIQQEAKETVLEDGRSGYLDIDWMLDLPDDWADYSHSVRLFPITMGQPYSDPFLEPFRERFEAELRDRPAGYETGVLLTMDNLLGDGQYSDPRRVLRAELEARGVRLQRGVIVEASRADGVVEELFITEVGEHEVTLDYYHPLAGQSLPVNAMVRIAAIGPLAGSSGPSEQEKGKVVVYSSASFAGASNVLGVGEYLASDLLPGDADIASMRVPVGFRVSLYTEPGFGGVPLVVREDMGMLPGVLVGAIQGVRVERNAS